MSAVEGALDELGRLQVEQTSLELFAVSRVGDGPPDVSRVLLGASLDQTLREAAVRRAHELADLAPRAYAPAALVGSGEVMHLSPLPALLVGLEQAITVGDVAPYDPGGPAAEHLRLLGARITTSAGQRLTLWRELKPTVHLARSRWFAARWSDGRYDRVAEDHLLLLDGRFDAVVVGDLALFTTKSTFERLFDFLAELRETAADTYRTVTRDLRIEGAAELEAACTSNPTMMAKMASVRRQLDADPRYRATMTMDRLVAFVRAHPETEVEVSGHGPAARLVFHPDRRRFKILKLLDDDYLHSLLTERSYEAGSKSGPL